METDFPETATVMTRTRIDFNLLVIFDAIATSGSVSKAAGKLSLSQPAVSHALNRLRDQLDDKLFVRNGQKLVPTPRALDMIPTVEKLLREAQDVFSASGFDPAGDERVFRLAASDYSHLILNPAIIAECRRRAPRVGLQISGIDAGLLDRLANGALDVSFWGTRPPPEPYRSMVLFRERFVGVVDGSHPLAQMEAVSLSDYLAFPHVTIVFGISGQNPLEIALERVNARREVKIASPSFVTSLSALRGTDLVATLPSRFLDNPLAAGYARFELPLEPVEYDYHLIWHARSDNDPGLLWFRELIRHASAPA